MNARQPRVVILWLSTFIDKYTNFNINLLIDIE